MLEPVILCPNCHTEIKLTESLAAPLVDATRREYETKLAEKDGQIATREATVRQKEQSLATARDQVEEEIQAGIRHERQGIAAEESRKARLFLAEELDGKAREVTELGVLLQSKTDKLAEAQNAQAELIRKQRELDDAKSAFELTVETRVEESLASVREKAKHDAEEHLGLKVAEQGSQQAQGEVQELALEALLAAKFPGDEIASVPKGEFGGDVVQRVYSSSGQCCGTILWESKRTRNWSDTWLAKLRDDQRAARADFAILVTRSLPKDVKSFDFIEGVWVVNFSCAIPVAIALRQSLLDVANVRQLNEGQLLRTSSFMRITSLVDLERRAIAWHQRPICATSRTNNASR